MSQVVDLYFDFSCPWSYLALVRLRDATDRNAASIRLKPVSVDRVLATENPGLQASRLAANPAKAAWQQRDLQQWAAMWGLSLSLQPNWPCDGSLAGAGLLVSEREVKALDYSLAVFRAYFGEGADICDPEVLAAIAAPLLPEGSDFLMQLNRPDEAAQVQANSLELIERGGFGTPSMFVGDELFFGNDRVPLVEWTLGPVSDAAFVMPGQHSNY